MSKEQIEELKKERAMFAARAARDKNPGGASARRLAEIDAELSGKKRAPSPKPAPERSRSSSPVGAAAGGKAKPAPAKPAPAPRGRSRSPDKPAPSKLVRPGDQVEDFFKRHKIPRATGGDWHEFFQRVSACKNIKFINMESVGQNVAHVINDELKAMPKAHRGEFAILVARPMKDNPLSPKLLDLIKDAANKALMNDSIDRAKAEKAPSRSPSPAKHPSHGAAAASKPKGMPDMSDADLAEARKAGAAASAKPSAGASHAGAKKAAHSSKGGHHH